MDTIRHISGIVPAGSKEEAKFRIDNLLLDFMRDHETFAQKKIPELSVCGRETSAVMWTELSTALNHIGAQYYQKDPKQWHKYWDEIRLSVKNEMSNYFNNIGKTGNRDFEKPSDYSWHVAFIYGFAGLGLNIGTEAGVGADDGRESLMKQIFEEKKKLLGGKSESKVSSRDNRARKKKHHLSEVDASHTPHCNHDQVAAMEKAYEMDQHTLAELEQNLDVLRDYRQSIDDITATVNNDIIALSLLCLENGIDYNSGNQY